MQVKITSSVQNFISNVNSFIYKHELTCSMQKISVEVKRHEGVRQFSEPAFDQARNGVDDIVVQTRRLRICAQRQFKF